MWKKLLFFSILAILSGATSYRDISRFIKKKRKSLNKAFGINWEKTPSKSQLRDVLCHIEIKDIESVFRKYTQALSELKGEVSKNRIGLDGKALRGSFDKAKGKKMLQLLGAFCAETELIVGHTDIAEKTNEIPTAQQLIKELELPAGTLYTADALHCQKKTFEAVKEVKGELVVQIKGNQKILLQEVTEACESLDPISTHIGTEKSRNRVESRVVKVFDIQPRLKEDHCWKNYIGSVVLLIRYTQILDKKTSKWNVRSEAAYYLSSHIHCAEYVGKAIREHWHTENRNHYVRDVSLDEDASRIRTRPGVFARLRSFAINILRTNHIQNIKAALFENALDFDGLIAMEGLDC